MKVPKPSQGKRVFRGLIKKKKKKKSQLFQGELGALLLAVGHRAGVRDALKEKLQR